MNRPSVARRWFAALGRATSWHRRKLAVVAVVAAVLSGLGALAPPAPETVPVVRTQRALMAGEVLSTDDIRVDRLPPDALPAGALSSDSAVLGKVLGRGTADGQLLSSSDLADSRPRLPGGRVVAPLRLNDEQVVGLLSEGMSVDVLAADERSATARVIAAGVRVAAVPPAPPEVTRSSERRLILVEVTPTVANALAQAAVVSQLSVVWQ